MALQLVITNAGRAAVIDLANGGFRAVRIAAVGVSPTAINAAPASANLADEVKRIATIAGEATATDVTHLTVTDESADSYIVRSFALYLSDGTLFALYGQADPIVQKSAQALLLLAIDVALSDVPAAAITFGNANFINPAATTERAGVIELATLTEAKAGTDVGRAITPATAKAAVGDWIGYAPANKAGDTFSGTVKLRATEALRVEGVNSYLSFCNEGGTVRRGYLQFYGTTGTFTNDQGGALTLATGGKDVLVAGPSGVAVFGGISRDGATVWDAANDGAGSGLDADLLDGRQANEFALLSGANFAGRVVAAGGLHADQYCYLNAATPGFADVAFDAGDVFRYNRSDNRLDFLISGESVLSISAGNLTRSGSRIWDAANDGAGSGLDADLLDGRHAADFALLSGAQFAGMVQVKAIEALRLLGENSYISYFSEDGMSRRGYLQFYGTTGTLTNDQGGALTLATGGKDVLVAGPAGIAVIGGLWRDGARVWDAANDGSGSGLDADLLDGRQANEFALLSGAVFSGRVTAAGGIHADAYCYLNAAVPGFADVAFDAGDVLRYDRGADRLDLLIGGGSVLSATATSLNRAGNRIWDAANDGAGSGLDADLLDGWQRDDVRDWNNILNRPTAFPVAAHTHGAADIAGAFPGSLSGNGYTILPNGLILQWVTGAQQAASSEGTQYVAFPIAFNTCFQVITSTQVANPNIESHAIYQLISFAAEGATVMRQLVSASGADREPSWPRLFAIGR